MILKRQKLYSQNEIRLSKNYKFVIPKHDIIDARIALEKHEMYGGKAEADRFLRLYKIHAGKKPHKFIQKIIK